MPSRLRSRHEYCSSGSMPACCWISTASASALMRAPPRGPSGIITTIDAACRQRPCRARPPRRCRARAAAPASTPGTKRPRASAAPATISAPRGTGGRACGVCDGDRRGAPRDDALDVGRQLLDRQRDLPDVLRRRAAAAADQPHAAGDEAPRVGGHVLGRAEVDVAALDVARLAGVGLRRQRHVGRPPTAARSVSSIGAGPTLQFTPTTSAPRAARAGANCSGGVPSRLLPSSSVVICATIGRSHRRRDGRDRRADLVRGRGRSRG